MKPKVKVMLLGIAIMLLGRIIVINTSNFLLFLLSLVSLAGFGIVLYGFFSKDEEEDLPEKIYEILRKQQRDAEEDVICTKCGEKYKESYNACPWCGHKKAE